MSTEPPTGLSPAAMCGLYVHVPFCETKCGYCDFFSVALKNKNPGPLQDRLVKELRGRTSGIDSIRTVFIGGGTPTLLPAELLKTLLQTVSECVEINQLVEFTVEANPATVDEAKARLLAEAGVSRVSMGAQSFNVGELAVLERLHSPSDIAPSVATLRHAGIKQVNLDLIFGIPGQTLASWLESLRRAIELGPDHIACYGLTYEPATRLTALQVAGRVVPCPDELEAEMFLATIEELERAGYQHYEISNYARPGCESRHNLMYWRNQPYIGVGPSAAGCLPLAERPGASRRYKNVADIAGYVQAMDRDGSAVVESEIIEGETLILEIILMQLRLVEGVSLDLFRRRTGFEFHNAFGRAVDRLAAEGLIDSTQTHVRLTRAGLLKANYVMSELAADLNLGVTARS